MGKDMSANTEKLPFSEMWLTTADQSSLFQPLEGLSFDSPANGYPILQVDAAQTFQAMEGFGFSLTGGSAQLINRLPAAERAQLLQEIYSKEGIGVSSIRLTLGASDLSERAFSYDDMPEGDEDPALAHFDILAGDADVIPVLKEILAINPEIKILASPWSAPPWMKTNRNFKGGRLRTECLAVYADYFVKYIQAMKSHGIPIHAITPQNEPLNQKNEPSMLMGILEQADFIKNHLGPALHSAGLETEIFCWDHNCDRPDYPLRILMDEKAREFVAGSAWHLYGGWIDVLSSIHEAYPDKKIYFTEQWVGRNGNFAGDLGWHAQNVLIGSCRNWASIVLEWNLASDPDCGPHTPGGEPNCLGALTIGEAISRNVAYYLIAHASKFVRPGSVRIQSNLEETLPNAAFLAPDGKIVLIVYNGSEGYQNFNIGYAGQWAKAGLEPGSLATYVWQY